MLWGPDAVSARRLRALVSRIPLTGAVGLDVGDPRAVGWTNVEELLAVTVESIDATNRLLFRIHSKKGTSQPKPLKVPRPSGRAGETEAVKKRPATSEELKEFFGGAVRYTGGRGNEVPAAGVGEG